MRTLTPFSAAYQTIGKMMIDRAPVDASPNSLDYLRRQVAEGGSLVLSREKLYLASELAFAVSATLEVTFIKCDLVDATAKPC